MVVREVQQRWKFKKPITLSNECDRMNVHVGLHQSEKKQKKNTDTTKEDVERFRHVPRGCMPGYESTASENSGMLQVGGVQT